MSKRFALPSIVAVVLALGAATAGSATASAAMSGLPHYDHVFLVIDENHGANQILGNPAAPEINALANDYGLATANTITWPSP